MNALPNENDFIEAISEGLNHSEPGLYTCKAPARDISFPTDGNKRCAEIELNSFWFRQRNEIIKNVIKNFPSDGPIFDVGGGNGFVASALIQAGLPTIVIEPGPGALIAKERGLRTVIRSTLEQSEFHPDSLPSVGMFDVLEHIEDDLAQLQRIHNLLSNKGYLYLTVPAYSFLNSHEDEAAGHFRRYTRTGLSQRVECAGFDVCYSSYFFSGLVAPIFFFRTLPSRLRLKQQPDTLAKSHNPDQGLIQTVLGKIANFEAKLVAKKKIIPFGSSVILVAKKR